MTDDPRRWPIKAGPRTDRTAGDIEDLAAGAVDPVHVREELAALVAIPSVTGDETRIVDDIARRLAAIGVDVHRWAADLGAIMADPAFPGMEVERTCLPLVSGTLHGALPGPTLMLLGHVDVVPTGDRAAWGGDPFEPRLVDGRLVGRGACDMKGGDAAILAARPRPPR